MALGSSYDTGNDSLSLFCRVSEDVAEQAAHDRCAGVCVYIYKDMYIHTTATDLNRSARETDERAWPSPART